MLTSVCEDQLRQRLVLAMHVDSHRQPDIWGIYRDGRLLAELLDAFAATLGALRATHVAGIESKGFVLAAGLASRLGTGFVPVRKGLLANRMVGRLHVEVGRDGYSGADFELCVQEHALYGARVVLVDDWIQTGSSARAAAKLVHAAGGVLLGMAVIFHDCLEAPPVEPLHYALRTK